LDPLYVANEGKLVAIVAASATQDALCALQGHPLGENARIIGRVTGGASKYGGDANSVWHHADRRYARGRPVAAHLLGGHALHEIAIASSIPETADAEARKRPGEKIIAVGLRVGNSPASAPTRLCLRLRH
jgi:hypothetical protein